MNKLKKLVLVVSLVLTNFSWGQSAEDFFSKGEKSEGAWEAAEFYEKACYLEHSEACKYLGELVRNGYFDSDLAPKIKNTFEKVCNKGNLDICTYLGFLYYNGEGIKADYKQAKRLFEKSCNGNAGNGCDGLALLYEHGEAGLKKNLSQAFKLYEKACKLDDVYACNYLSDLYKEGKKVKKDMNKSYKYQKRVCDLGGFQAGECSAEEKKFLEKYK